ncbi:glycosyltransferase [Priestia sp. Y58]|uniref:glycosyltransferase n=1 Tax=Priestia sp. Y58 TaxID=2922804 RepID=UPI00240727A6|nr:glycosyltransferase [Priestia sp. Y58]MDG0032914.1 glycosyltransferase [Priestia sp. Y58]
MEIDVGIVMPVYRQESSLFRKAIESIINQKYSYFHLVIVIDGVTPNVISIAKEYASKDSRITMIPKKDNSGTNVALNIGFNFLQKNTNVQYLTWVSSDNIYYPDFVGVLKERLENSPPHVGLAYSGFHLIDDNGKHNNATDSWNARLNQPKENLINEYFIGYAFMYKKVFSQKIEGYKYMPVEDYDYFLRLTEHCDITFIPQKLMAFRLSSPYSNSLQIKNSLEKRRRRRYLLHLVRKEARQRRNISPELTIIFPVSDSPLQAKQELEKVLEQSFSNYKLIIHDLTSNGEFHSIINEIPDVRIQYLSTPNGTLDNILLKSLELADTRLVMFFRRGNFRNYSHLKELVHSFNSNPSAIKISDKFPEFGKVYKKKTLSENQYTGSFGEKSKKKTLPESQYTGPFGEIYKKKALSEIYKKKALSGKSKKKALSEKSKKKALSGKSKKKALSGKSKKKALSGKSKKKALSGKSKKKALSGNQYTGPTIANNRIIVYIPFNNLNVQKTLPKNLHSNSPKENTHLTEEWINKRIFIFMNFTLKSLINQSNQNYLAFIVYHDSSRQFIEKALQNYPKLPFNIRFVSSSEYEKAVIETLNNYKYFYELHLYSDDAYHKNYIEQLYHYRPSLQTKVLICQNGYIYDSITDELAEYYNLSSSFNCLIYKVTDYLKGVRHNIFQPSETGIWTGAIRLPHEIISERVYINHSHKANSAFFLKDEKRRIWRNKKGEPLNLFGKTITDKEEKQRILQEFLGSNYRMDT